MEPSPRLSRWEVVGAWLRLWTPPRGAVVPPVPWRPIVAVLAIVAVAAVLVGREVGEGRRAGEARDERAAAERAAVRRAAQTREQRAVAVRTAPGDVAALERAITAEAQRRYSAGEVERRALTARCRPTPGADLPPGRAAYDCLAITGAVPNPGRATGAVGYPFRAVVDEGTGRGSLCATNPIPGERVVPDPDAVVRLPAACRVG
jgi:hypothetical protein